MEKNRLTAEQVTDREKTFMAEIFSSWGISLFLHAILMIILTFTITQVTPQPKGITPEETADVGIAFRTQTQDKVLYESAADALQEDSGKNTESPQNQDTSQKTDAEKIAALSTVITGADAPDIPDLASLAPGLAPSTGSGSTGLDRVTDGLGDLPGVGSGTFEGFGKGKISCFGTSGEGNTFIFVFDRSASMSFRSPGATSTSLNAAKQELRRSLRMLQPNQQFQIIFYNGLEEDMLKYEANQMIFATKPNIIGAERFLSSIIAMGGTDHKTALSHALRQRPDVIFFLTDADENETTLNSADLERIRRNATGTQINAIQFGSGPRPEKSNWLSRLAEQNGGQYMYLDVSQLHR
ncbi:MAG: hypothetical protein Q4C70_04810 [Planctomycetia bacterium]|nr:hypothetical protein [Planctomycetia bacterium]